MDINFSGEVKVHFNAGIKAIAQATPTFRSEFGPNGRPNSAWGVAFNFGRMRADIPSRIRAELRKPNSRRTLQTEISKYYCFI